MNAWRNTYSAWTPDVHHLIIERRDGKPVKAHWDVLQRIKNEVFGEDTIAIEIYPAQSSVVNETNRRHFWVVAEEWIAPFDLSKR